MKITGLLKSLGINAGDVKSGDIVVRSPIDGSTIGRLKSDTPAQVQTLIQQAQAARGWRILCFHAFSSGAPSDIYTYRIDDFAAVLDAIAASGIEVVTVAGGLARMRCP